MAGSLAVQKDLRPITISDCAGLGYWSSASVRHLLTCLATSCLGFLSLLDEASLGFPPPLLPLQFCMCHLLKPFLSRSVSSPGSETPRGWAWCPQAQVWAGALCGVAPCDDRTGTSPLELRGHCVGPHLLLGRRQSWWRGEAGSGVVTHLITRDEGCSGWKGRCDQGQRLGPGREPLESEQSGSSTGLL